MSEPSSSKPLKWERSLQSVIDKTGWDRKYAVDTMKKAKKELGIRYLDYNKYGFYAMSEEEQKEKAQKILKRRKLLEKRVQLIMENSDYDREACLAMLKNAKEKYGITNRDFVKYKLYNVPEEKQLDSYEKRKKRRELLNSCITSIMSDSDYDREACLAMLKNAKEKYGITNKDFVKYKLYNVPEDEQLDSYEKRKKRRELLNSCIASIMSDSDYDRKACRAMLDNAKTKWGISYQNFVKYRLYSVPEEEQLHKYERDLNRRALRARRRYINRMIEKSKDEAIDPQVEKRSRESIEHLRYKPGSEKKQPDPVIAACYYLGIPLPENATMEYQPSAYTPQIEGGLDEIKKRLGKRLVPDTKVFTDDFAQFRKKYLSMSNLCFTETDLLIYYTDHVMHSRDYGYSNANYFDFEFYRKSFDERNEFISTETYRRYVSRVCIKDVSLFKDKVIFNNHFASILNRDWLDMATATLEEFQAFTEKHPVFFAKPTTGTGGHGARKIDSTAYDISELYEQIRGDIIEEIVKQHPKMAAVNKDTLNTIRVYALYDINNTARMIAAFARFGRPGSDVDNFHSGGMGAAVDPETGVLITNAVDLRGVEYEKHPDSGITFKGFQIPEWDKLKEGVAKGCALCADINRHVGWDIAITENGNVEFIEGNCQPNFDFLQAVDKVGKHKAYSSIVDPLAEAQGIRVYRHSHPDLDVSSMQAGSIELV